MHSYSRTRSKFDISHRIDGGNHSMVLKSDEILKTRRGIRGEGIDDFHTLKLPDVLQVFTKQG